MPRQRRWKNKRDLDNAIGNISAAEAKISTVGDQFKGVHDDYYQAFLSIFVACESLIKATKELRDMI